MHNVLEERTEIKVIIRHLNSQGRVHWILDTLPLTWTRNKSKAKNFQSDEQAIKYINQVGINFASVEEIEAQNEQKVMYAIAKPVFFGASTIWTYRTKDHAWYVYNADSEALLQADRTSN